MKSEKEILKDQARLMGIPFSPNIGVDTLRQRINDHLAKNQTSTMDMETPTYHNFTDDGRKERMDKHKAAMKLSRIILVSNDPNKKEYHGELLTVGNSEGLTYKKFIPFGKKTHIPQIMYNLLKEKEVQTYYKVQDEKGRLITKTRQVKAYNIEDLPPISRQEYEAIRQRQTLDDGSE